MKTEFTYPSADGQAQIHAILWEPETAPVGIVQISHGLTEYAGRHEPLALFLNEHGYVVVANDTRGHGTSIAEGEPPLYFGEKNGWMNLVEDLKNLKIKMQQKYRELPYFMLGFSLGSFAIRTYLLEAPQDVRGVILAATGHLGKPELMFVKLLAKSERKKHKDTEYSENLYNLMFGTYNRLFKPNRTEMDWLCANDAELDKYLQDPLCKREITVGMFAEFALGMSMVDNPKNIGKMPKNAAILLLSGDKDPLAGGGKKITKLANRYRKAGICEVSQKMYPGARHDLFSEACAEEVRENILSWLNANKISV